jgi:hypothetical protein
MNTDTPTPRTNAAEIDMSSDTLKIHTRFVQADFARQLERELSDAGKPTDAAAPNGSAYARLKWWKNRAGDLHDQLAAKDGHADDIYKAAVGLAKKLEDELAAQFARIKNL